VELEEPSAFSELIGRRVIDSSGRSLGRVFEARAHWERDTLVIDELLLGRKALLRRLFGPAKQCRGIPWEAVIEMGPERIVTRTEEVR
jgi:sporulation protein YlmC with PRC-barrel domain